MTRFVIAALALTSILSTGCERTIACTDLAAISVSVTVEDSDGNAIPDAVVTFDSDGGTDQACDSFEDGQYNCGYEVEGEITVNASADGFGSDSDTVTVDSDECHVIGETMTLVLQVQD